jgi:predicted HicB family RNase H-like nuclease
MDLTRYIEGLQRDLAASAAAGGDQIARAAELLTVSIESSVRLALLEALSEAADEITTRLGNATVDVRLRGREADLTVTEIPDETTETPPPPAATAADSGDLARITLRLPELLKEEAERAAAREGISVNAWLVRAIASAVGARTYTPPARRGRRITGFAQG